MHDGNPRGSGCPVRTPRPGGVGQVTASGRRLRGHFWARCHRQGELDQEGGGCAGAAVQELLGHSTMTTLRYTHLPPEIARDAVKLLDTRLG